MPKSNFNEVAKQLQHGCSPVIFLHIFSAPFPKHNSGELLLFIMNLNLQIPVPRFTVKVGKTTVD